MSFGGINGAATEVAPLGGKGGGTAAVAGDQQYGSESRGLLLGGAKEPLVGVNCTLFQYRNQII